MKLCAKQCAYHHVTDNKREAKNGQQKDGIAGPVREEEPLRRPSCLNRLTHAKLECSHCERSEFAQNSDGFQLIVSDASGTSDKWAHELYSLVASAFAYL